MKTRVEELRQELIQRFRELRGLQRTPRTSARMEEVLRSIRLIEKAQGKPSPTEIIPD